MVFFLGKAPLVLSLHISLGMSGLLQIFVVSSMPAVLLGMTASGRVCPDIPIGGLRLALSPFCGATGWTSHSDCHSGWASVD